MPRRAAWFWERLLCPSASLQGGKCPRLPVCEAKSGPSPALHTQTGGRCSGWKAEEPPSTNYFPVAYFSYRLSSNIQLPVMRIFCVSKESTVSMCLYGSIYAKLISFPRRKGDVMGCRSNALFICSLIQSRL